MRKSSKYILGGLSLLVACIASIVVFGLPQRMNYPSPQAIGLFLVAIGCTGYGAFLRVSESLSGPQNRATLPATIAPTAADHGVQGFGRKAATSKLAAAPPPQGEPMTWKERSAFELLFRQMVEQRPLSEVETMLREAIFRLDDPALKAIIERPAEETYIDRWSAINTAMVNNRDGVANGRMGAMILGLVHRNSDTFNMTIDLSFSKTAEPAPFKGTPRFPEIQTEAQYQELDALNRSFVRLPDHPRYKPLRLDPLPRLVGLEAVMPIYHRENSGRGGGKRQGAQLGTAYGLAADMVFLRFCQAVERHLHTDSSVPRLPAYLTVEKEPWPGETGTLDYCSYAVRLVSA
jgi:hypothetical protein